MIPSHPRWTVCPGQRAGAPVIRLLEAMDYALLFDVWLFDVDALPGQVAVSVADDLGTVYAVHHAGHTYGLERLAAVPAPPERASRLTIRVADDTVSFDLDEERTTVEPTAHAEYRDAPVLATKVDGERALRATALRHRWLRLADPYLDGALGALVDCELVSAERASAWRAILDDATSRAARLDPRVAVSNAVYLRQPTAPGVRLTAVFVGRHTTIVRWRQVPPEFEPGVEPAWVTGPEEIIPQLQLGDDRGSSYVQTLDQTTAPGAFSLPFWLGETSFLTDADEIARTLEVAIAGKAAHITLNQAR
jgi:hypothetical protein